MSIAKAGIITTLNARTSILAAANPVGSKYVREWPITRNIDLPPTLISRFDLLYLVLDNVDEIADRRLAQHLVGLYLEDAPETGGQDILPLDQLSAYISYSRSHIHPVITEDASKELVRSLKHGQRLERRVNPPKTEVGGGWEPPKRRSASPPARRGRNDGEDRWTRKQS